MRREELYLADLIDNARAVRGYLDGVTRERWDAEDILRDAVLYRMLLLGEIAGALPDELRDRYPDVAWRQIRAFRNLAVHKYLGVDWAVVWKTGPELRAGTHTGSRYRLTRARRRGRSRPATPSRHAHCHANSRRKSGVTPVSCSSLLAGITFPGVPTDGLGLHLVPDATW
jgi:uncharacterized protein with HEPN domain